MRSGPYSELLHLPVRTNGIELARPVDVLVGAEGELVGFEVQCRDGIRRFLPFAAAEIRPDEIHVASALVFLDQRELSWYRRKTTGSAA